MPFCQSLYVISAILSLQLFPKKPAAKPELAVSMSEKPETAGFPKSQDCPQPNSYIKAIFLATTVIENITNELSNFLVTGQYNEHNALIATHPTRRLMYRVTVASLNDQKQVRTCIDFQNTHIM